MRLPWFKRERLVVIVDDSPEDREVVRRFLKKDKEVAYRFLEHGSGAEGLRTCRAPGVDCLLLDYDLPDINGLQFLAELNDGSDQSPVPVIMLTGRGGESVAVQALKRGAPRLPGEGELLARDALENGALTPFSASRFAASWSDSVGSWNDFTPRPRESDRRKDEFLAMPGP